MRRLGSLLLVALALTAAPRVAFNEVRALERGFDRRIASVSVDDPLDLVGFTRGAYVEGFGVVFTTEINLVVGPAITPFRPKLQAEDVEKLRQRKLARIPQVKQLMRDMLVSSATALKTMPPEEQIVVGMSFFQQPWENNKGLPDQLLMQAKRQALLDFEKGALKSLDAVVRVQEF